MLLSLLSSVVYLLAGTYTGAGSEGIYVWKFDQDKGIILDAAPIRAKEDNPSFLTVWDDKFYSISEIDKASKVRQWEIKGRRLVEKFSAPVIGKGACHVSTDGRIIAVSNYGEGTLELISAKDGHSIAILEGSADGADKDRQGSPHVHCAVFSPDGNYIFASDFSGDKIIRYEIATGLSKSFSVGRDYGPRHLVFSNDKLYVIGELSGDITVFDYLPDGELKSLQVVTADKLGARGAADIKLSPDAAFLYASLRLENDGIAVYKLLEDGTLQEQGYTLTGKHPRNFNITPNGKYLLCCCRDSDVIEIYAIDRESGLLTKTGREINLSKPVCADFL